MNLFDKKPSKVVASLHIDITESGAELDINGNYIKVRAALASIMAADASVLEMFHAAIQAARSIVEDNIIENPISLN